MKKILLLISALCVGTTAQASDAWSFYQKNYNSIAQIPLNMDGQLFSNMGLCFLAYDPTGIKSVIIAVFNSKTGLPINPTTAPVPEIFLSYSDLRTSNKLIQVTATAASLGKYTDCSVPTMIPNTANGAAPVDKPLGTINGKTYGCPSSNDISKVLSIPPLTALELYNSKSPLTSVTLNQINQTPYSLPGGGGGWTYAVNNGGSDLQASVITATDASNNQVVILITGGIKPVYLIYRPEGGKEVALADLSAYKNATTPNAYSMPNTVPAGKAVNMGQIDSLTQTSVNAYGRRIDKVHVFFRYAKQDLSKLFQPAFTPPYEALTPIQA